MNICNIMLSKKAGGLEMASVNFSRSLAIVGCNMFNVVRNGSWAKKELINLDKEHVSIPANKYFDFTSSRVFAKTIKDCKIDAILAHGRRAVEFAISNRNKGIMVTSVVHSDNFSLGGILKSDRVICINDAQIERVADAGFDRSRIYKIANTLILPDDIAGLKFTPKDFDGVIKIGFMARFEHKKGVDVFLRSMANLKGKCNFRALIAGVGEIENDLKKLCNELGISDRVEWVGYVDKWDFYKKLDIFVNSSRLEAFGLNTMEAMACGVATIATRTNGSKEIVVDGSNGILVSLGDHEGISSGILSLVGDSEDANRMASNGFNDARLRYSPTTIGKKLKGILGS